MGRGEGPRMQEPPPKTPHFVSEKPLALEAIHILMETMNIREKKMLNKGEIVSPAKEIEFLIYHAGVFETKHSGYLGPWLTVVSG